MEKGGQPLAERQRISVIGWLFSATAEETH
jgi:hypothetical protein